MDGFSIFAPLSDFKIDLYDTIRCGEFLAIFEQLELDQEII